MKNACHLIARRLLKFVSLVIILLSRRIARLSDRKLVAMLNFFVKMTGNSPQLRNFHTHLAELKQIIEEDPRGNQAVRRLLTENRREQFIALLSGLIRRQIFQSPHRTRDRNETQQRSIVLETPLVIGLIGDGPEAALFKQAYQRVPGCTVVELHEGDAGQLSAIAGLEVISAVSGLSSLVAAAQARGVPVSLHYSLMASLGDLLPLGKNRGETSAKGRVFYPYLHYQPVRLVEELLRDEEIGEVATVRVRATMGGEGGVFPPAPLGDESYLYHPAFAHCMLLIFLGGRIEAVTAYSNPFDHEGSSQGLVAIKYAHPGRYGLLECSYARQMYIHSRFFPYDLEVEVAGSDGIIWLRRGMSERVQGPPVVVRTGRKAYSFGIESGLIATWDHVYERAAFNFAAMIRAQEKPLMSLQSGKDVQRVVAAAIMAAQSQNVVTITEKP